MSENDTSKKCKDCGKIKDESDFRKNTSVCKACIKKKTNDTKSKKEEVVVEEEVKDVKRKNISPIKNTEEKSPSKAEDDKFNKKKKVLIDEFTKMLDNLDTEAHADTDILKFIKKLSEFAL